MIVLVTGATGGFGQVLSRLLLESGLTVYGTSRNPERHQATSQVPLLALDVSSQQSADACIAELVAREGRIDVLVNCVNDMFIAASEEQDVDEVARLYDTNVFGVMRVCKAAIPVFRQHGGGLVINVGTGEQTSLRDLWKLISGSSGTEPQFRPSGADEVIRFAVSPVRARIHLSWSPWTALADGLAQIR